ncbi:MAG: hypothetical protein KAV40_01780 [Thermoplasmatales archaeon]|nr:hypothetical protein [Thermoplasmatales archaeon]
MPVNLRKAVNNKAIARVAVLSNLQAAVNKHRCLNASALETTSDNLLPAEISSIFSYPSNS